MHDFSFFLSLFKRVRGLYLLGPTLPDRYYLTCGYESLLSNVMWSELDCFGNKTE